LLTVVGFNPVTSEFKYQVNSAFGRPFDDHGGTGSFLPFQVRLGAAIDLGTLAINPDLKRLGLVGPHDTPSDPAELLRRLRALAPDPVSIVESLGDSLNLSPAQRTALRQVDTLFNKAVERAVLPAAAYLQRRGKHATDAEFHALAYDTMISGLFAARTIARNALLALLTPAQQAKLAALRADRKPL
jgi:hypothetical protein